MMVMVMNFSESWSAVVRGPEHCAYIYIRLSLIRVQWYGPRTTADQASPDQPGPQRVRCHLSSAPGSQCLGVLGVGHAQKRYFPSQTPCGVNDARFRVSASGAIRLLYRFHSIDRRLQ